MQSLFPSLEDKSTRGHQIPRCRQSGVSIGYVGTFHLRQRISAGCPSRPRGIFVACCGKQLWSSQRKGGKVFTDSKGDAAGVPTLPMLNRSMSFSGYQDHHPDIVRNHHGEHDHEAGGGGGDQDDMSDDGSQVLVVGSGGEKKKRLNMEQVKALEKNFEQANKLEPEKKIQLAKALGLQPRQVAIWFQNRRARWKTKQLEKDYNVLKRQYDALKADNDSLLSHNNKLHAELMSLRNGEPAEYGAINLNNVDTKSFWSNNGSEISTEMNLNNSRTPQTGSPLSTNPSTKLQFSSNSFIPSSISQLLHTTSKPELDPQPQNDSTYCNLFNGAGGGRSDGIENQPPPFWGWPEHQQNLN